MFCILEIVLFCNKSVKQLNISEYCKFIYKQNVTTTEQYYVTV